jgi:hypothetical protein
MDQVPNVRTVPLSPPYDLEQRTFEFAPGEAGAEAWLRLQGKYGVGDNVMGLLTGHLNKMAQEIAMAEVIGPNHQAIIAAVTPRLKVEEAKLTTAQRLIPSRALESSKMVEKTYDVLTGRARTTSVRPRLAAWARARPPA